MGYMVAMTASARTHAATAPPRTRCSTACARVEGQVRGVRGMVEDDRYCIDVLTQIGAAQAALDKVALGLLDEHARHCVMGAGADARPT